MRREQILAQLKEEQIKMAAVQAQLEGLKKLFDAAVIMQNNQLADSYRTQMHDLLDMCLDTASGVAGLMRATLEASE